MKSMQPNRLFASLLLLPVVAGCLSVAWAQQPTPESKASDPKPTDAAQKPTAPKDPQTSLSDPQSATGLDANGAPTPEREYAGPQVLSRGGGGTRYPEMRDLRFQPYIGVAGIYTDELAAPSTTEAGQLVSANSAGVQLDWGLTGRRIMKKDTFGLTYGGSYFHYTADSHYDGSNQFLTMDYAHHFSKRLSLDLSENAGVYNNNFPVFSSVGNTDLSVGNINFLTSPNIQIFDNRTIFSSSQVYLVYHQSSRLSFSFGGAGFLVRREAQSLYDTTGAQARTDVNYRVSRRATIGAYYAYTYYSYNHSFGSSWVHTGGMTYSFGITRSLELRLRGGISHVETVGNIEVNVDPSVAAILGISVGLQAVDQINYVPDISAQLIQTFRKGTAAVEYTHGVSPGDGVYLTSVRDSAFVRGNYTGIQGWSFGGGGGYDGLSSIGFTIGRYSSYLGQVAVSRRITRSLSTQFHGDFRHYNIATGTLNRSPLRITFGIYWSPADRPLTVF